VYVCFWPNLFIHMHIIHMHIIHMHERGMGKNAFVTLM
jgi:hypothetical protein